MQQVTMTCVGLLVLVCVVSVRGEMYTALVQMEKTLEVERHVAQELRAYVRAEQQRLQAVLEIAEEYEKHSQSALKDPLVHLSHPVNAFLLVKRFTTDWDKLSSLLSNESTHTDFESRINDLRADLPTQEDLRGSAVAMFRLQDTYQLSTGQIAQGDVVGEILSPVLEAGQCFELGRLAYVSKDYYHTILWMTEALEKEGGEVNKTASRAVILDYLSFSLAMQGNHKHALEMTEELLGLDSSNARAANNKEFWESVVEKEDARLRAKGDDGEDPPPFNDGSIRNERPLGGNREKSYFNTYEALCRGEDVIPNPHVHQLKCRYVTNNHPLLLLAPAKEEEAFLEPRIVVFHDLMNDEEMAKVKELATPRLHRAGVFKLEGQTTNVVDYRISKHSWLKDEEDPLVRRVTNRVEAVTGLNQETSEELQVVNYGIGGHYEPHCDFARRGEESVFEEYQGNRIATVIFYLSEVAAGGATVFTDLGIKVFPEKGMAAFWYNIKKSGDGDYSTIHAGCPVLAGNKWVANKWIHERGQEFRRLCALDRDE